MWMVVLVLMGYEKCNGIWHCRVFVVVRRRTNLGHKKFLLSKDVVVDDDCDDDEV